MVLVREAFPLTGLFMADWDRVTDAAVAALTVDVTVTEGVTVLVRDAEAVSSEDACGEESSDGVGTRPLPGSTTCNIDT